MNSFGTGARCDTGSTIKFSVQSEPASYECVAKNEIQETIDEQVAPPSDVRTYLKYLSMNSLERRRVLHTVLNNFLYS